MFEVYYIFVGSYMNTIKILKNKDIIIEISSL